MNSAQDLLSARGSVELSLLELREARALQAPDEIARILTSAGVPPLRLAIVQEDLEEHFLRVTREAEGDEP